MEPTNTPRERHDGPLIDLSDVESYYRLLDQSASVSVRVAARRALLADIPLLVAEVRRVSAELIAARMALANLRAAAWAALGAHRDGEHDPWWYLRDELSHPSEHPSGSGVPDVTGIPRPRRGGDDDGSGGACA